jgi:tRNA G18 (ribose-2'-O)-methylase SpoU
MGSAFRLGILEGASIDDAVSVAHRQGSIVTGASLDGAASYLEIDWSRPRLLIFGSEAHGLTEDEKSHLDEVIRIPMASDVESLNLAVSAGIILFEAKRQLTGGEMNRR